MQGSERLRENIILVGFMGSGKSSIGKRVAQQLGFQFLDTDQMIVDRTGLAITELFAQQGEEAFREQETAVLNSVAHLNRCVVSTGGGIILRAENRALLRKLGFVVSLTASEDVIWERVSRNNKRPLLHTEDPRATMARLLETRQPLYIEAAHFTLDTTALNHSRAAEEIVKEARRAFSWHRES